VKRDIKTILFFSVAAAVMVVIIGFTGVKNSGKRVNDVLIEIQDQNGDYFTDQMEIISLMNAESTDYVLGQSIEQVDLKLLEERVESNPFVKEAQIYRDIKGNLLVKVEQARPIARIYNPNGPDQYVDEDGRLLPVNAKHTARVPIIETERGFSWERSLTETDYGNDILALLNYIESNEFWKAQIAQLVIEKDGQLKLLPQVTKQEIIFGMPEDLDSKFKKLMVFYKEILPNKGWNTYELVNVKFENQIVCE
tara:strand:- start:607 stop:1362 length:756 start_codon:yes stop_codon:yes gene_type:complete